MTEKEIESYKAKELFAKTATLQLFSYNPCDKDNKLGKPEYCFSGCFYKDYILSVFHGINDKSIVTAAISIDWETKLSRQMILSPCWLAESAINIERKAVKEPKVIDFFLSPFKKDEHFLCEILDDDKDEVLQYERYYFKEISEPNLAGIYFFGGNIENNSDEYTKRIFNKFQFASCEFCGELEEYYGMGSFLYRFELPSKITDENQLQGCSGAPIYDMEGKLVSLLCGGFGNTPYIYGINLSKLQPLLETQDLWK